MTLTSLTFNVFVARSCSHRCHLKYVITRI